MEKIAVILIRGTSTAKKEIIDTLNMLRLRRKHAMVLLEKNPANLGMIYKVKDYVTYGEIDESFENMLKEKMPKEYEKGFFRLHPPIGGFERGGIKRAYTNKGALGYRGKEIIALIKKMMKQSVKNANK
ncbi:MAG: uL30 family ribosomal protein [Candidatus Woesearchaeota archaeon]